MAATVSVLQSIHSLNSPTPLPFPSPLRFRCLPLSLSPLQYLSPPICPQPRGERKSKDSPGTAASSPSTAGGVGGGGGGGGGATSPASLLQAAAAIGGHDAAVLPQQQRPPQQQQQQQQAQQQQQYYPPPPHHPHSLPMAYGQYHPQAPPGTMGMPGQPQPQPQPQPQQTPPPTGPAPLSPGGADRSSTTAAAAGFASAAHTPASPTALAALALTKAIRDTGGGAAAAGRLPPPPPPGPGPPPPSSGKRGRKKAKGGGGGGGTGTTASSPAADAALSSSPGEFGPLRKYVKKSDYWGRPRGRRKSREGDGDDDDGGGDEDDPPPGDRSPSGREGSPSAAAAASSSSSSPVPTDPKKGSKGSAKNFPGAPDARRIKKGKHDEGAAKVGAAKGKMASKNNMAKAASKCEKTTKETVRRGGNGGKKSAAALATCGQGPDEIADDAPPPRSKSSHVKRGKSGTTGGGARAANERSPPPEGPVGLKGRKSGAARQVALPSIEVSGDDSDSSSSSSVDLDNVVCCICRCAVDFSDPDAFRPAYDDAMDDEDDSSASSDSSVESGDDDEEGGEAVATKTNSKIEKDADGQGNDESSDDGSRSDAGAPPHPPLPHSLYDPHNALLLCDGEGCGRAYHQRCHFVPVLSVPRGEWKCLLCRVSDEMEGAKSKKGKKRSQNTPKSRPSLDLSGLSSSVSSLDGAEVGQDGAARKKQLEPSILNRLYRVAPPKGQAKYIEVVTASDDCSDDGECLESFEMISAPMKARLLHTETNARIKSIINISLSTIRKCEYTISTYTETSRARKSLLERYALDGRVVQELAQAVSRMAASKQRVRGVLRSLDIICKTNKSWEVDWILEWIKSEKQAAADFADDVAASTSGNDGEAATEKPEPLPENIYDLIFSMHLEKRRVEPRFETNKAPPRFVDYSGTNDGEGDAPDVPKSLDTVTIDDELSIDNLTCVQCNLAVSSDDNDLLMCDGEGCFRCFHQKCIYPEVDEDELHEDVDWFCPYCSALGKWIHYAQVEYLGDVWLERERRKSSNAKRDASDEDTLASWEHPSDVFPEAVEEERVASRLERGKRNDLTDRWLCNLLGIPNGDASQDNQDAGDTSDVIENDYDEDDDSSVSIADNSDEDSDDANDDDDDGSVEVEWKVGKSELNALSDYSESDESSSDEGDSKGACSTKSPGARSSKRLRKQRKQSPAPAARRATAVPAPKRPQTALGALLRRRKDAAGDSSSESDNDRNRPNVGALDASNIVSGRRNRTKVDYRKLNDAMFGDVEEGGEDAVKIFGKDDEYHFGEEIKCEKKRNRLYAQSSSSESESDSSSDDDSSDEGDVSADEGEPRGASEEEDAAPSNGTSEMKKKRNCTKQSDLRMNTRKRSRGARGGCGRKEKKMPGNHRSDKYQKSRQRLRTPTSSQ